MNTLAKKIILASNSEMHHAQPAQGKSKKFVTRSQQQEGSGILIIVDKRKEQINVNEEAESFK